MDSIRRRLLSGVVATLVCLGSVGPLPPVALAAAPAQPPVTAVGNELSGQAAIDALGANLQKVAQAHGRSAATLARTFKEDKTLHVDKNGRLFYKEGPLPAELLAEAAVSTTPSPWAVTYPLTETFRLHSNPGSRRVIYLDFDGQRISGSGWNSAYLPEPFDAPAWDTDGNASVFGDTERAAVQKIWQRVSEDYAPFDVDVTTEDPGDAAITRSSTSDEAYGMRVLVSPISTYFGGGGGIAYVDVFDSLGATFKPALVFPENLANGEKYIAEAISHECGHTLNLLHDGTTAGVEYYSGQGTGATGWAPIMGTGYYRNLTQWSKGEYALANNTEDDLQNIAQAGAPFRADDYPDTAANAPRASAGATVEANGVIHQSGDVDVFSFSSGSGAASLSLMPASVGGDLDAVLELRDGAGTLVAVSNPADGTNASVSADLAPGTYYVYVSGSGKGDPLATGYTRYASLGAWRMTGSVADPGSSSAPVPVLSVSSSSVTAPGSVTFDGTGSYDPEGTALTWTWDFGDGAVGTGATVDHTYLQPGVYTTVMNVTDASGFSASTATAITVVGPNAAPVAVFTQAGSGGMAPVAGVFDGSGSYDPDGSLTAWDWDFGDGSVASGKSVTHNFTQAGTYRVTLTVTDAAGARTSATSDFVVQAAPVSSMHVGSLTMVLTTTKAGKVAKATVRIVDANGTPVQGAVVSGTWSGPVTGTSQGTTGQDGTAVLSSKAFKRSGTVTFTVNKVSKSGWTYDASANASVRASLSAGSPLRSGGRR